MQNLTRVRRPRDVMYHSITSTGCCYTFVLQVICLKEKKTSKLCSFCVCSFSCYPREIFLTCFYRGFSFFLKLLKTFKIFYSAAKHFSLSFFLGFNFFCGIQYKIFLSQITRSVCHVFKLQAIKSLVYI